MPVRLNMPIKSLSSESIFQIQNNEKNFIDVLSPELTEFWEKYQIIEELGKVPNFVIFIEKIL